jgi:glc operon protein GlcG
MAKKIAAAAFAEVSKIGSWPDCVAIVDPGGRLVYFERMDNASVASVRIAIDKARTAALFRRPSKLFQDALTAGRTAILGLHGATPLGGGVPIIVGGKLIGALGVSGGIVPGQDDKVAAAGLAALGQ